MLTMIDRLLLDNHKEGNDDEDSLLMLSIRKNVENLLNTRQNSVSYLPDLGMPDLTEIYQELRNPPAHPMQEWVH